MKQGARKREEAEAYLAQLRDTHADVFLTSELHPRIQRVHNTAANGHGLFGYSYRGLFSLYAWLIGGSLFESIGAGSPGVIAEDSQVFALLDNMDNSQRTTKLHVTLNDQELFGDLAVYQSLAKNAAAVVHRLTLRGEAVSRQILR